MISDSYHFPRIDERINSQAVLDIFYIMDTKLKYGDIVIDEPDHAKTALTSHLGLYQSVRIPIGLKNAP